MISSTLELLISLGFNQWMGFLFAIIYVYLAGHNRPSCWIFGIISSIFFIIVDVTETRLLSDALLNGFYVIMGVVGLYQWRKGQGNDVLRIDKLAPIVHCNIIILGLLLGGVLYLLMAYFFEASSAFLDAQTTIFSIIATFLLVYRKLYNWIYFIVVDVIYIFLYYDNEAPLFSILFFIYTVMAIRGFLLWRKQFSLIKGDD